MRVVGVICEYNPFHLGHKKQFDRIRQEFGEDTAIVCIMSGNFVQRGHPAVFDKMCRAKAALHCGADLVLELPVTAALSSAEGFAAGGVSIASKVCDTLCFGAETASSTVLMETAQNLLSDTFRDALRIHLDAGLSFPAARQAALADLGAEDEVISTPNNILAVEYCKAILTQGSNLSIFPIHRVGSYHDTKADPENPSATSIRKLIAKDEAWHPFVPEEMFAAARNCPNHTLEYGEKAMLARLRTMTDAEFEAIPYGSEGLWRKLMHASRLEASIDSIVASTKSKRYARTRLDRMILLAFLNISAADLGMEIPYVRVLGFTSKGRVILNQHRKTGFLRNIGEDTHHPYQQLEHRCTALYGLFSQKPERPAAESDHRVIIK